MLQTEKKNRCRVYQAAAPAISKAPFNMAARGFDTSALKQEREVLTQGFDISSCLEQLDECIIMIQKVY